MGAPDFDSDAHGRLLWNAGDMVSAKHLSKATRRFCSSVLSG